MENSATMLRLTVLGVILTICLAVPGVYGGEPYLSGHIADPAVVAGHHLPAPLIKTYAHPPLYGAYPGFVKEAVIAPAAGFIKAPILPAFPHGGHYGHVSPYIH